MYSLISWRARQVLNSVLTHAVTKGFTSGHLEEIGRLNGHEEFADELLSLTKDFIQRKQRQQLFQGMEETNHRLDVAAAVDGM